MTKLSREKGLLRDIYKWYPLGTMLHSDELYTELVAGNETLNSDMTSTADGVIYFVRDGSPMMAITREKEAFLLKPENHEVTCPIYPYLSLTPKNVEQAISSPETVLIEMTKLNLESNNSHSNTTWLQNFSGEVEMSKMTDEEIKLGERMYGISNSLSDRILKIRQFEEIRQLAGEDLQLPILQLPIYCVKPEYVKSRGSAIAYLCQVAGSAVMLNHLPSGPEQNLRNQFFFRKSEDSGLLPHFRKIIENPDRAVQDMDEKIAADLNGLIQKYLLRKEE